MKRQLMIINACYIIAILILFWFSNDYRNKSRRAQKQINALQKNIDERDRMIAKYEIIYQTADTVYKEKFHKYDSIENLRHENNNNDYHFSADSIERLWSERFGHN